MRLSAPAIKHIVILNMAIAILKVRKYEDVVSKAVGITKDKKILNQKRKLLAKVDNAINEIEKLTDAVFSQMSDTDIERVRKLNSAQLIQQIPEDSTNPEILALYLLYINFNDDIDKKMDPLLNPCKEIDYFELILMLSEDVGLEKNVSEDMYVLAQKLIEQIKK
jgi:hypothetical protein